MTHDEEKLPREQRESIRDVKKYEGIVAQRKKAGENGAKKKWQDATNDSNVINSMAKIANAKSDMAK